MRIAEPRVGRQGLVVGLVALLLVAGATPLLAGGAAVEGLDRTRILPPREASVEPYQNTGYRLSMAAGEITIEVAVSALDSSESFVTPKLDEPRAPVNRLALALTHGSRSRYAAVSRILGWIAGNIDYQLDRAVPQDAAAVLQRRSGYCTGVARLTVALLTAVEIPAREVAGFVVAAETGRIPIGYHRWIEVDMGDRGWVFSDPLTYHHYVPATYVRLASEQLLGDRPGAGLLLAHEDRLRVVDLYPTAVPGVRARRNSSRQLAGALRVEIEGLGRGLAVLEGDSARRSHQLIDGATTFLGLEPGSYLLRLLLPGRPVVERSVEMPDRIHKALLLPIAALEGDRHHPSKRRKS